MISFLGTLLLAYAAGPTNWGLKAWLGVVGYILFFFLFAWWIWRIAGPGRDE